MGDRVTLLAELAQEIGKLKNAPLGKKRSLGGYRDDEDVMPMMEVYEKPETDMPRETLARYMDYWLLWDKVQNKSELLEVMKREIGEAKGGQSDGGDYGGQGKEKKHKDLNYKVFSHMKDSRYNGKDGGLGWNNFYEDMMVAIGSVNKDLEGAVKMVTDLKN